MQAIQAMKLIMLFSRPYHFEKKIKSSYEGHSSLETLIFLDLYIDWIGSQKFKCGESKVFKGQKFKIFHVGSWSEYARKNISFFLTKILKLCNVLKPALQFMKN